MSNQARKPADRNKTLLDESSFETIGDLHPCYSYPLKFDWLLVEPVVYPLTGDDLREQPSRKTRFHTAVYAVFRLARHTNFFVLGRHPSRANRLDAYVHIP